MKYCSEGYVKYCSASVERVMLKYFSEGVVRV